MNCCKTCKHWIEYPVTRRAYRVENKDSWGNCDIADGDENGPHHKNSLCYCDGVDSDSTALLITYREFGCIQHEEK